MRCLREQQWLGKHEGVSEVLCPLRGVCGAESALGSRDSSLGPAWRLVSCRSLCARWTLCPDLEDEDVSLIISTVPSKFKSFVILETVTLTFYDFKSDFPSLNVLVFEFISSEFV